MSEKYSSVLTEGTEPEIKERFPEGELGPPPAIILESEIGAERDENTPLAAWTERVSLLESKLGKIDPSHEDFDVILADIAAARIKRDDLLTQMHQKDLSEKKSALFSAAGRKGSFVRQLNRLKKIMSEGTLDTSSEEYISIAERRKSLEEKLGSAQSQLQESRNVYTLAKNTTAEAYGAEETLKLLFESNKDQSSEDAFNNYASKEAVAPEEKEQLGALIEEQKISKKALLEIQKGRRISFFEKMRGRIKDKIDQSPKLQEAIDALKHAATLAPTVIVGASLFAGFILGGTPNATPERPIPQVADLTQDYKYNQPDDEEKRPYTLSDRPTINDPATKEPVKNNISPAKEDLPEKYLSENVKPYPVDMSQTRPIDTPINSSVPIGESITNQATADNAETISEEPNNYVEETEEDIKSKLYEIVSEFGLNSKIIEEMSESDFAKFGDIYKTKQLSAFPGDDPLRDAFADYYLETL